MDIRKVKKLIEMLENSSLNEIVIKEGEESVKLVKSAGFSQAPQMVSALPQVTEQPVACLLYTSPSPRDSLSSRMPSSA